MPPRLVTPTSADLEHLAAFREAASQIREASIVANGLGATLRASRQAADESFSYTVDLLPLEPFRSLVVSVRLVYQLKGPANFGRICKILRRAGDETVAAASQEICARYNAVLSTHAPLLSGLALGELARFTPREVLDTWLNHNVFHQDARKKAVYDQLEATGDKWRFAVQVIALQLAGRALDLDDVIADASAQPRLPRAPGNTPPSADA